MPGHGSRLQAFLALRLGTSRRFGDLLFSLCWCICCGNFGGEDGRGKSQDVPHQWWAPLPKSLDCYMYTTLLSCWRRHWFCYYFNASYLIPVARARLRFPWRLPPPPWKHSAQTNCDPFSWPWQTLFIVRDCLLFSQTTRECFRLKFFCRNTFSCFVYLKNPYNDNQLRDGLCRTTLCCP